MGLNTKLGPAKSFLVKLDASGAKVEVLDDAMEDNPKYLYHATNFCNL